MEMYDIFDSPMESEKVKILSWFSENHVMYFAGGNIVAGYYMDQYATPIQKLAALIDNGTNPLNLPTDSITVNHPLDGEVPFILGTLSALNIYTDLYDLKKFDLSKINANQLLVAESKSAYDTSCVTLLDKFTNWQTASIRDLHVYPGYIKNSQYPDTLQFINTFMNSSVIDTMTISWGIDDNLPLAESPQFTISVDSLKGSIHTLDYANKRMSPKFNNIMDLQEWLFDSRHDNLL